MNIRQIGKDDIKALTELAAQTWAHAFGHTFSAADAIDHINKNLSEAYFSQALDKDIFLGAEIGNRIIGFVQFGDLSTSIDYQRDSTDQELRRLYVLSDFQNKGVGRLLMDAALVHPRLKNAKNIFLDVWENNVGGQKFYQRYGFEIIGERKFAVPSGAETSLDLIMVRSSEILKK